MTTTTGRFDLTRWDEEVIDDGALIHPAGSASGVDGHRPRAGLGRLPASENGRP